MELIDEDILQIINEFSDDEKPKNSCIVRGCRERAKYRTIEHCFEEYCFFHKTPEMYILNGKYCYFENCTKIAAYNCKGVRPPCFCGIHKTPGMINTYRKECDEENCTRKGSYKHGIKNYCKYHRKDKLNIFEEFELNKSFFLYKNNETAKRDQDKKSN